LRELAEVSGAGISAHLRVSKPTKAHYFQVPAKPGCDLASSYWIEDANELGRFFSNNAMCTI
jgi:hypothetical protein